MQRQISEILRENDRRLAEINAPFNPVTGENSVGERRHVRIRDYDPEELRDQWLPVEMFDYPLVADIAKLGSVDAYLRKHMRVEPNDVDRAKVREMLFRIRIMEDVYFWFATLIKIKPKGGGAPFLFVLRRPQRKLVARLERMRRAGKPIRLILLKARQWGGSTAIQMYMAWLQLVHKVGLNSLVVAQVKGTAATIRGMFEVMLQEYPVRLLHEMGDDYDENEKKIKNFDQSGNTKEIPQRMCKIKVGSAEKPDSARGDDYNLVHCSEVGLWKKTDNKTPEDIVRSATSGITYTPYTMIVYESTANGTGNFFHIEYEAAEKGESQFEPMFVAWYEIYDLYHLDFAGAKEREEFAAWLYDNRENRNAMSDREECGAYLWKLWEKGAPLEALNWYIIERKKYTDHGDMASEFPSDSIEAFKHSGARVFDEYKVEAFRKACRAPRVVGDVYGDALQGKDALSHIRFTEDHQGLLWVWEYPETFDGERVKNRYLVVVDIGGRGNKADWSVILVIDRYWMMEGDKPEVVAQWYGHIDMDLLAWKAAQIAKWYDDALLVIESNTLETKDRDRVVEGGDQSEFILNQIKDVYDNLYARKQSEADIINHAPTKYGFHTNVSTKPMIISTLVKVVRERLYVERDSRALDEYRTYERKQNGAYGAIQGKHDDLLMTRAIGLHICFYEMEMPAVIKTSGKPVSTSRKSISAATFN